MKAKQSKFETKSRFESLARDLSHELKAMKNSVATMEARHEKQIEARHVDNICIIPDYRQDGLPVPARLSRSAMRYLFGIHALQHSIIIHSMSSINNPATTTISATFAATTAARPHHPATWAATAERDV